MPKVDQETELPIGPFKPDRVSQEIRDAEEKEKPNELPPVRD